MARKFKKAVDIKCPKCETWADVGSNRKLLFNAERVIAPTAVTEGGVVQENLQVFCGACGFMIEQFDPADYTTPPVTT